MVPNKVKDVLNDGRTKVLSIDIFDTILLRNTKPERLRFYEVSKMHASFLSGGRGKKRVYSKKDVFMARVIAHDVAYRLAPWKNGQRDASISLIFKIMLALLGADWDRGVYRNMCQIELDYEKENLLPNTSLIELIKAYKAGGGKVFFLSDMYFESKHIDMLLRYFLPAPFWNKIYVSGDHSLTKKARGLFEYFMTEQNLCPEEIVHMGDNRISDYDAAEAMGIRSLYFPRSIAFKMTGYVREKAFTVFHGKRLP